MDAAARERFSADAATGNLALRDRSDLLGRRAKYRGSPRRLRVTLHSHINHDSRDVETSLPTATAPRDNLVVIVERWETLAHLEAHLIAPHMLEYRPKVKAMIDRVALQILESVASQP